MSNTFTDYYRSQYPIERKLVEQYADEIYDRNYSTDKKLTPEELIDKIQKQVAQLKDKGCTDVHCRFDKGEDYDAYTYIQLIGKRPETDEEYRRRLTSNLARLKLDSETRQRESKVYEKRQAETLVYMNSIQKAVEAVDVDIKAAADAEKVKKLEAQLQKTKSELNKAKQGG